MIRFKKITMFVRIVFCLQIGIVSYAMEKKVQEPTPLQQSVIELFQYNYAPLAQGFALIGQDYHAFLQTQIHLIPADDDYDDDYNDDQDNFMEKILTNAKNIINSAMIERFAAAIAKNEDLAVIKSRVTNDFLRCGLPACVNTFRYPVTDETLLSRAIDCRYRSDQDDDYWGRTIEKNNKDCIELLLAAGADLHTRDSFGRIPLHDAAYWGRADVASLLITVSTINAKDNQDRTPLHIAEYQEHHDVYKILIAAGADKNLRDKTGKTAMDIMIERNENILERLW